MKTITFEHYTLGRWIQAILKVTAVLYDRDDAHMLCVCDGNRWDNYNPVRNVIIS